jgi:hypothetical protein
MPKLSAAAIAKRPNFPITLIPTLLELRRLLEDCVHPAGGGLNGSVAGKPWKYRESYRDFASQTRTHTSVFSNYISR